MGLFDFFKSDEKKSSIDLTDYKFLSDNHTRIENGRPTNANNKGAWRGIRIKSSDNCTFYVTMYNMNGNHPVWGDNIQMAEKRMKLINESNDKIVLRGFGTDAMGGSFADYGITLHKTNGDVKKVTLHMHDRNIDIIYEKAEKVEEFNYSDLPFYVVNQQIFNRLINSRTVYKIWEEQVSDGQGFSLISPARQMRTTGKNHFMFQTATTEKMVGISNNDEKVYNIPWELLREEVHKGKKFLIFCGWGDPMSTGVPSGLLQFNYYEIGIEKTIFANLVAKLMSNDPNFFSISKMRNVIGLEGFRFENGQILI